MHHRMFAAAAVAALAVLAVAAGQLTHVQTTYGPVIGAVDDGVVAFHSIPFAAPPVGALRFAPPVAPTPWTTPKNVTTQPPMCSQGYLLGKFSGSEDCLYLHVYTPANATAKSNLPVMVWIYGGGFIEGDAYGGGRYDGRNMSINHDVVVVAMNYRVGPFGFLSSLALAAEDPMLRTGNAGTLDQQFALQWVQNNIANFGGDAKRVTIFGQSAGGFSVCWHLVAPGSAGLFQAAIMESGSCDSNDFYPSFNRSADWSSQYAASVGCPAGSPNAQLACMRSLSTIQVLNSSLEIDGLARYASLGMSRGLMSYMLGRLPTFAPLMPWGPTIDGVSLTQLPLHSLRAGQFNKVPTIFGTTANEGNSFVPMIVVIVPGSHIPPTTADVTAALVHILGSFSTNTTLLQGLASKIISAYPSTAYNNNLWWRAGAVLTDYFFTCGTRRSARAVAAAGVDMYLYHFTFPVPNWLQYDLIGDFHAIEVPFVFGNPSKSAPFNGAGDNQMSEAMSAYWTSMAINGSPNGDAANLEWPKYTAPSYQNLNISLPFTTQTGLMQTNCDLWDEVMAQLAQLAQ